jgi:hypothetical protein
MTIIRPALHGKALRASAIAGQRRIRTEVNFRQNHCLELSCGQPQKRRKPAKPIGIQETESMVLIRIDAFVATRFLLRLTTLQALVRSSAKRRGHAEVTIYLGGVLGLELWAFLITRGTATWA